MIRLLLCRAGGLLLLPLISMIAEAQPVITTSVKLLWSDSLKKVSFSDFRLRPVYHFQGCSYDEERFGYLPVYNTRVSLQQDGDVVVRIVDAAYEAVKGRSDFFKDLAAEARVIFGKGYERGKPVVGITVLPFRRHPTSGIVERLITFRLETTVRPTAGVAQVRDQYAAHSVLSSGSWYKLGVMRDGLYRIDRQMLQQMGIDVNTLDPRNLRIYGNGGSMIPEANAGFRHDDLYENAIYVAGEEDGRFDEGDYLLFYGQGPERWRADTLNQRFVHVRHAYTDTICYFLTVQPGQGKRVSWRPSASATPTATYATFHDYRVHEKDLENFIASGRTFYGEAFEFEPEQTFSFVFPNIVSGSPVKVQLSFMGRSIYANNTVQVLHDNKLVASAEIPKVCSEYTCPFGSDVAAFGEFSAVSDQVDLKVRLNKNAADTKGWLNYLEVNAQRYLRWTGQAMTFRNLLARGTGTWSQFELSNAVAGLVIWDITNPLVPVRQEALLNGDVLRFTVATDTLKEFFVFSPAEGEAPAYLGRVANQDLHGLGPAPMIIVTPDAFLEAAQAFAAYHQEVNGLTTIVATLSQIYNEFSSGHADIGAIRDFVRMFYKRAQNDESKMPRYLLLLGDGSYDNKGIDPVKKSWVPTFQNLNSVSPVTSFVSDDFYGFLDDSEGGNLLDSYAYLDIAIGRIPAKSKEEALAVLEKMKYYGSEASMGNWRNWICFVADDEDSNVHINDAENLAGQVAAAHPAYNIDKIYLDAYKQVAVPGGHRYTEAQAAILNRLNSGTLMINYIGHGGEAGWAHERVLTMSDIQSLKNLDRLPLFITATCEFTRYDDPSIVSAGELLAIKEDGGAIALVTTCRLVYSSANAEMNEAFMYEVLRPGEDGFMLPLGEVFRRAKNATAAQGANNRKFTLIGDPALRLAYPTYRITLSSVSAGETDVATDTVKALQKITVKGVVEDLEGQHMSSFNGVLYATVFDKAVKYQTLKNDASSYVKSFYLQKNVIYNGKASIRDGAFTFSFIVPKDISYQFGPGKFSFYATSGTLDAQGYRGDIIIGGIDDSAPADVMGPQIRVYMNDEQFVRGGITDENPIILVRISDSSGINTVGTGIGHDITGELDFDSKGTFVMNDYYSADLDSYTRGEVRYPLYRLTEGWHHLRVKAWDVYNNSSEGTTEFVVASSAHLALSHVLNYPNPFTTHTEFMFEHNQPGQVLEVLIQIYTVSGRLVKTLRTTVVPASSGGYRVSGIKWDGRDEFGDRIGRGVYVYRLSVQTATGKRAHVFEKLVLLK
ncbi:MAG: type IX secretion system sortase PorU [Chitinophagales bacterium]|nr:type IX secretion system sortase PorU [Chitinophagales bacterium]MDW8427018.1 type IX secretion system sortase PorU [Chitinophagales bacterium]